MAAETCEVIVRRTWDETPSLKGVLLEVPQSVAAQFVTPGQVVVLRGDDGAQVYLAIASAPGEAQALELLVGPGALAKVSVQDGKTLSMDPPSGNGFPMRMIEGCNVLLFAVGSALAPIRSVIEFIRKDRARYRDVTLFIGAHSESDFPYAAQYASWTKDGIEIKKSISRPWVQEVFSREAPSVENAAALVCGMKPMMEGVTEALTQAGLAENRIGRNW